MVESLYAFLAVVVVSLLSLIGLVAISVREETLDRILFVLISFAAGSILGTAFLDLLPEGIEFFGNQAHVSAAFLYITLGFLAFFFLERFIYWYHGHLHGHESKGEERMAVKRFVYLNLIGDGIHNFIDGMIIATGFLVSFPIGVASSTAVILHELPQEIGDFGVLLYGGFTRRRALLFNFLSALTALAGVLTANLLTVRIENFAGLLIAIAAGGFIYLSASELIPEIQKEENIGKSMVQFALFVLGILLIWSLDFVFPE